MQLNWKIVGSLVSIVLLSSAPIAAQTASVPAPDRNGDFTTALQPGNRGNVYQTQKWLVVDPDPTYLNCRIAPNGRVRSRIAPGAIITAEFDSDAEAIVMQDGASWLRIRGTDPLMVGEAGVCYVRANSRYIAPINPEALAN